MNNMFVRNAHNDLASYWDWRGEKLGRILYTGYLYVSDYVTGGLKPSDCGKVWVNGHHVQEGVMATAEAPSWQVLAVRVPHSGSSISYLGGVIGYNKEGTMVYCYAGGLRLGEVLAWSTALTDEEILDASAYLMKKWLGRTPGGYEDGAGIPQIQHVVAGGDTAAIDVATNVTAKIGSFVADGTVKKTGAGTLEITDAADFSAGQLVVEDGQIAFGEPSDVASNCEIAAHPTMHLDPSDTNSIIFLYRDWQADGTNYVWNWQDMSGRMAALFYDSSDGNNTKTRPYCLTDVTCNGLRVVDFGETFPSWHNDPQGGRYMPLSRTLNNVRAVYMVLGSQEGGGQPLGSRGHDCIDKWTTNIMDFMRTGSLNPTLNDPLFASSATPIRNGELWINGEKQANAYQWKPSGAYDLVELHTTKGVSFNALGNGFGYYVHGGCRFGEIVIFERPLTEREKTATRNYLLKKWFNKSELDPLPAKPAVATTFTGNMALGNGYRWDVAVKEGAAEKQLALTGTLTFGAGVTLNVTGLSGLTVQELKALRIVVAHAGDFANVQDVTITGDGAIAETTPYLTAGANGNLTLKFAKHGFIYMIR